MCGADKLDDAPVGAPPPFIYLEAKLTFRAQGLGCDRIARTKAAASLFDIVDRKIARTKTAS
jgi:hypothetical protein